MPQRTEPSRSLTADDWLLVGDSADGPVRDDHSSHSRNAREIDTSDMAGLLASMKLQCGELAEAQQVLEQSLENQTHEIETQKQQLSSIQDKLHRSLEEHTLDMRQRLTEKIVTDCEAPRKELRQDLATDVGKLQGEMEKIMQLLHEETEQRQHEVQKLEESMEQSRRTQQEALENVNKRAERLEKSIARFEKEKQQEMWKQPPSKEWKTPAPGDHQLHRATKQWSVFCDDCRKEFGGPAGQASKDSCERFW